MIKYTLMNKNKAIFDFESEDEKIYATRILDVYEYEYAPLSIEIDDGIVNRTNFNDWLSNRRIPASRENLLQALDMLSKYTETKITTSYLAEQSFYLSLSDQYWIKPLGSNLSWDKINFFTNHFSDDIGNALFDNKYSDNPTLMSPCNSSEGNLKKKWKIIDGERCLIKSGTGNTSQEVFNEKIASRICELLGFTDYVSYSSIMINNAPANICKCFINENSELLTANDIQNHFLPNPRVSPYEHYITCCKRLGYDVTDSLDDMITLDFIIGNTDRHYRNFGLIRDVNSLEIIKAAPIFDNGTSLCHNVSENYFDIDMDISSKPFAEYHSEQIKLVKNTDKYILSNLGSIKSDCYDILSEFKYIPARRIELVSNLVENRIQMLDKAFCRGYVNGINELDLTQNSNLHR